MPDPLVARARLVAQGLVTRPYPRACDAVSAFAAMQGQDLPGVIASAALRSQRGTADEVLDELNSGRIVRGYPMRGTVFLMPGADVVWISELCAGPAIRAARARRHLLALEESDIELARDVAVRALETGTLSRAELFALWEEVGISPQGGRGYHIASALISEATLCYGPWNGVDQDLALVSRWVPAAETLRDRFDGERVPAVAELLRRYLTTHGPATVRDFAWWTKLPLGEIRRALELVDREFESDSADEPSYWREGLLDEVAALGRGVHRPLLLPGFDEFILGYQDRTFAMSEDEHRRLVPGNNGVFKRCIVANGQVVGLWSRTGPPGKRRLVVEEFSELTPARRKRLGSLFAGFPHVTA